MLCSPLTAIPAFLNLTQGKSKEVRSKIAAILGISVAFILVVGTWAGGAFLDLLGVRIAAFQCAGGIIVFLLGLSMLNAQISPMRQTEDDTVKSVIPIVPIAIPLMAGPGALSGVIVAANTYPSFTDSVILSICGAIIGAISAVVLYFGMFLEKTGAIRIKCRDASWGLILVALAVEIFAQGIQKLFL